MRPNSIQTWKRGQKEVISWAQRWRQLSGNTGRAFISRHVFVLQEAPQTEPALPGLSPVMHMVPATRRAFDGAHLQQLEEVLDVGLLRLLGGELRLLEVDVLVIQCLQEETQAGLRHGHFSDTQTNWNVLLSHFLH